MESSYDRYETHKLFKYSSAASLNLKLISEPTIFRKIPAFRGNNSPWEATKKNKFYVKRKIGLCILHGKNILTDAFQKQKQERKALHFHFSCTPCRTWGIEESYDFYVFHFVRTFCVQVVYSSSRKLSTAEIFWQIRVPIPQLCFSESRIILWPFLFIMVRSAGYECSRAYRLFSSTFIQNSMEL